MIAASGEAGWRHGLVSLAQWYLQHGESLPCIELSDAPRFGFRGIFLDCARHFHPSPPSSACSLMSLYKFNRFHWHLTDDEGATRDQGLPQLTELAAWRGHALPVGPQLSGGPEPYGGYYTQSEVRELVAYGAGLGITIIPEIDIPVTATPPSRRCPSCWWRKRPPRYLSVQYFDDNVLNPALPGTYRFLEAVMDEVCELFPGPLVHMGDEVPPGLDRQPCLPAVDEAAGVSGLPRAAGPPAAPLPAVPGRQGQADAGLEEILHGDKVSRDATIFAWTSFQAGLDAATAGYPVVMAPAQHLYLISPGARTSMNPASTGRAPSIWRRSTHVTRPQPISMPTITSWGCWSPLWSELITSRSPRLYVVPAHAGDRRGGLSDPARKAWEHFAARLPGQLQILDQLQVRYRVPQR